MSDDTMDIEPSNFSESKERSRENLPWVEKYRPSGMDELISHEEILHTLQQLIKSNRLPHLLFYGPPGTGKKFYFSLRIFSLHYFHFFSLISFFNFFIFR